MKIFRSLAFAFTTALLASTPAFALDAHPQTTGFGARPQTVAVMRHHHRKHHRKPCRDARGRFTKC